jgi:outer membrane lipoprotein SlyB
MKCTECGSIESIRETENESEASEITIRLQDGSSRVMIDANPGGLRPGQRVKVIDGLAGPGA